MWMFSPGWKSPSYCSLLPRVVCVISQRLYLLIISKFTTSIVQLNAKSSPPICMGFSPSYVSKRWHVFPNKNKVLRRSQKSGLLLFPPRMHLNGTAMLSINASSKSCLLEGINIWHRMGGGVKRYCSCKQHYISELDVPLIFRVAKIFSIWNLQVIWIAFNVYINVQNVCTWNITPVLGATRFHKKINALNKQTKKKDKANLACEDKVQHT